MLMLMLETLPVKRTAFKIFNLKNADLENRVRVRQGHWKCHRSTRVHMTSYWHSAVTTYGSISCRFWDIQCLKMSWPWNWGQKSLKVI